jgi:hypothetical protein
MTNPTKNQAKTARLTYLSASPLADDQSSFPSNLPDHPAPPSPIQDLM